eukprot:801448-Pelagomonas_calceolata.AAC.4
MAMGSILQVSTSTALPTSILSDRHEARKRSTLALSISFFFIATQTAVLAPPWLLGGCTDCTYMLSTTTFFNES